MFYLKQFAHIFKSTPIGFIAFLSLTVLFFSFGLFSENLSLEFQKHFQKPTELPYFQTLVEGKRSLTRVQRRLQGIPGVEQVKIQDSKSLQKKLKKSLESIQGSLQDSLNSELDLEEGLGLAENYSGLKIYLDPDIKAQKIGLIQEYISRLIPNEEVIFSGIKQKSSSYKNNGSHLVLIVKYGHLALLVFIGCFWIVVSSRFYSDLGKRLFLLNRFRRTSKSMHLVYLIPLFTIFLLSLLASIVVFQGSLTILLSVGVIVFGLSYLMVMRSYHKVQVGSF